MFDPFQEPSLKFFECLEQSYFFKCVHGFALSKVYSLSKGAASSSEAETIDLQDLQDLQE